MKLVLYVRSERGSREGGEGAGQLLKVTGSEVQVNLVSLMSHHHTVTSLPERTSMQTRSDIPPVIRS